MVEVDDRLVPASSWPSRRSRQLVAYLALADGRRATAEQVMDALWPDLDPEAARANLHKAASLARRALGSKDAVVIRDGSVALWPSADVRSDVAAFEAEAQAALCSGDPEASGEAATSYGGELLPEERYEEWTLGPRQRARRLYVDVLRASGQWEVVVEVEPTDEAAHRRLMREHMVAGRLHAALRQFQRLRAILGRELGMQPSAETLFLYREVVGIGAPGWFRPGLVGREVEMVRARAALRRAGEGRPAAILVSGAAGIGKTRLCEELVDQAAAEGWLVLRAQAREPTATVPYAPLTEAVAGALVQLPKIGAALGDDDRRLLARLEGMSSGPAPALVHRQSVLHLLLRVVGGSGAPKGVLFLDDLHHADDATVELAHILATAPFPRGLLLVATFRGGPPPAVVRLRDSLAATGTAVQIELDGLLRPEIDDIVAHVGGGARQENLDLVWELSGGNPFLALELASSADALATGCTDVVHTAVAARMRRLPPGAEEVLRRVALVADEFSADEFAALSGIDAECALDVLEASTGGGVVARLGSRYRFRHDLLRDELCRGVPDAQVTAAHGQAAERLAELGAPAARVASHLLAARRPSDALPWLRRAIDDAFAVGAQADASTLAAQALEVAPGDPELLARRAAALDAVGDPGAPAAYAVAMAVAHPSLRASLAVRRANALILTGDVWGAMETLASIDEVPAADRSQHLATRGLARWCAGELDGAEGDGLAAKDLAEASGDLRDFVAATLLLAMVAHQRGAWPQRASLDLFDSSLRSDLANLVMDAHLCVAESYLYGGAPYPEVIAFAADLRERAVTAGVARAEAFATTLLGEAHLLMGDTVTAREHLGAAVALHRTVGILCGEALSLQRLAEAQLAEGDGHVARGSLNEAFVVARGSPVAAHHLLDRIHGTAIRAAPDSSAAVAAVEEAAQSVRGPLETCPPCSVNLTIPATIACAEAGDRERAMRHLAMAEAVVGAFFPRGGWSAALDEARAAVALSSGDVAGAARLLKKATDGFDHWGQRLDAERCRRRSAALPATGKV